MNEFKIPKSEQDNVMHMMWVLMRELETVTINKMNDGENVLFEKKHVESSYELWNRITGSNLKPFWQNDLHKI